MSMEFFEHSVFFGVSLSLLAYGLGVVPQKTECSKNSMLIPPCRGAGRTA